MSCASSSSRRGGRRNGNLDSIARFDPFVGVSYRFARQRHVPLRDEGLQARARKLLQADGEEVIQPPALVGIVRAELAFFSVCG